jgi:hypothetical protein
MNNFQPIYIIYPKSLGSIRIPKLPNSFENLGKTFFRNSRECPNVLGNMEKFSYVSPSCPIFFG